MPLQKIFLRRKQITIEPFGDHVRESFIRQKTLAHWQAQAIHELGAFPQYISDVTEIRSCHYPCLVIDEDLFFTSGVLREFLRSTQTLSTATRLAVKADTHYFRICAPFQEGLANNRVAYGVYYYPCPEPTDQRDVLVDIGECHFPVTIPPHMLGDATAAAPGCLRPIIQIRHPVHLLWANHLATNVRYVELMQSRKRRLIAAIRARSIHPTRALAGVNKIGRNCTIHPSAVLEGVELGDNVKVGANVVIRMSNIGDGCDLGEGSVIRLSVLGPRTVTFDGVNLNFVVTYPDTFLIHGPYNLSIFGRESAVFATILTDFRLDRKPIRLEIDGRLLQYPFPFVGSFIGHRTRIGGGSIIAPGRLIPNDLLIFPALTSTLTAISRDVPKNVPLAIESGHLQPISRQEHAAAPQYLSQNELTA